MPVKTAPMLSRRHRLPYDKVPSSCKSIQEYGATLDTAYEMSDDISTGNGVSPESAVEKVCTDEGFRVLHSHRYMIATKLGE